MNLENALITGGSGMVGSYIHFGYKPTSSELNVVDYNSIEKYVNRLQNVSCIIHLVATNLRESEQNPCKAIDVNINGTTNMLRIAMKYNVPFILLSSGAVFSSFNSNVKFDEMFSTCPNSVYGSTKASSEQIALLYNKTILIRTGWLFGGNQKNHYKFVESAINNLLTNNQVKASNNFYGSPTYVVDLIERIKYLIVNNAYGVHHVINSGSACGYDIALEIANILNIDKELIVSVQSHDVPNSGPVRSLTEILASRHKLRHWKESLREYVTQYCSKLQLKNVIETLFPSNKTLNKKWSTRDKCRLCNSYNLKTFLKLNPTPPANHFVIKPVVQEVIPLDVCICDNCSHVQLMQIVDPAFQYSNYFYVSSTSESMTNHLKNSATSFTEGLQKNDYILEIGANDGVCIKHLIDNGYTNVIGVDPAININKRHNLPIICDYFGSNILTKFNTPFKLIFAFHCCAHIENIQDVFQTVYQLLDDTGIFIMEVGYFYEVFKNNLFDTIYHEHIDYHTCKAIQRFAYNQQLLLYKVRENSIQGGSIQFYFCKDNGSKTVENSVYKTLEKELSIDYNKLASWHNKITLCGNDINYMLNSFVSYGKKIAGYGASAKSTTFLYEYRLNSRIIDYIIDDSVYKQNYYSPGLHIPIKSIQHLNIAKVDYIIILSWNFTDEIVKKLEPYRQTGLRIIVPFPEIKIL